MAYVRFMGHRVVTSSTDSSLGWWNLQGPLPPTIPPASGPANGLRRLRTMRGHVNRQNFVGLAVREQDSLIACGSEMGRAFTYHTSWDSPMAAAPLDGSAQAPVSMLAQGTVSGGRPLSQHGRLVSAVAWRPLLNSWPQRTILAAAFSEGDLGLLSLEVDEAAMLAGA